MTEMGRDGDSNQITRRHFDSLLLEMRHIDAVEPSTDFELYGHTFKTPVMLAALSHLGGVHPDSLVEVAKGAAEADAVMWAGMGDDAELEAIIATGAKTVKIIKPYADSELIFHKIAHAEASGAIAVGMDIDHAFTKKGTVDVVQGKQLAPQTLDDLKRFVGATKLPFVVKGVLSVRDALKCLDAGVGGIVLSHHHGIMDYAAAPLMVLPAVAEAVGGKIPLFVDCGVQRGMDVFKALALGASAVSVGRAVLEPLRNGGAEGVRKVLDGMTAELKGAMAYTCTKSVREIDPTLILRR